MTAPDARDELREAILRVLCVEYESVADEEAPVADALLPVITAWADSLARVRAAEELREARNYFRGYGVRDDLILRYLHAHAAALAADDQPDGAR